MKLFLKTKGFRLCALLLAVALTSGCWGRKELDDISIVMGMGIDTAPAPDIIELSVQVAKTKKTSASDEGSQESKSYLTMKKPGMQIPSILQKFGTENSRYLFLAHNQVVIFGSERAQEGILSCLDFFSRFHETRSDVLILVAKGTANEVLTAESDLETIPAMHIARLAKGQRRTSESFPVTMHEFVKNITGPSGASLATLIDVEEGEDSKKTVMSGMAVFKEDQKVGELTDDETRGFLWAQGEFSRGILVVTMDDGSTAAVDILGSNSKTKVRVEEDGSIVLSVKVTADGIVDAMSGLPDLELNSVSELLQQGAEENIKNSIHASFDKAQLYGADFFQVGSMMSRYHPEYWKELEKDWYRHFSNVKLETEVDFTLRSTGRIGKNAKMARS